MRSSALPTCVLSCESDCLSGHAQAWALAAGLLGEPCGNPRVRRTLRSLSQR
jgi:hypothetical protein